MKHISWLLGATLGVVLVICMISCLPSFEDSDFTGIPIDIPQTDPVDLTIVLTNAEQQVQQVLPEAYLVSFTFTGSCNDLSQLRGVVNLGFLEVHSTLIQSQVLSGLASTNTISQTMDIRFADHSDKYPNTARLLLEDAETIGNIARRAEAYIVANGFQPCDVIMTRIDRGWHFLCTEPKSGPLGRQKCVFVVDPVTHAIVNHQDD